MPGEEASIFIVNEFCLFKRTIQS